VIGGKSKNRAYAKKKPKKHAVLALVDRDGLSYSFHTADVKAKTLRESDGRRGGQAVDIPATS
jgi:hypothetical protein